MEKNFFLTYVSNECKTPSLICFVIFPIFLAIPKFCTYQGLVLFLFVGTDFSEAVFNQQLADAAAASAEELEQEVSVWTKMLNISEGLAKGLGFVGAIAGCVVMGFQLYRDFKHGASIAQKSLDICQVRYHSVTEAYYRRDPLSWRTICSLITQEHCNSHGVDISYLRWARNLCFCR